MPFNETKRLAAAGGPFTRGLRRIFIEDWGLKLLALAITLVLWFVISGRQVEREVPVDPRVLGKPAPSFVVKEIVITPAKVRVSGPASHVDGIEKAEIEAISVEGRRESFDVPRVQIRMLDSKVSVLDKVNVHVTIVADGDASANNQVPN
jgi:YbbR domain-containing protein